MKAITIGFNVAVTPCSLDIADLSVYVLASFREQVQSQSGKKSKIIDISNVFYLKYNSVTCHNRYNKQIIFYWIRNTQNIIPIYKKHLYLFKPVFLLFKIGEVVTYLNKLK